jgi:hypothetical protein
MDRAGTDVQYDVVAAQFVLMGHIVSSIKNAALRRHFCCGNYLLSLFSQAWLEMPQLVLQADWQEVWHSPQPPFLALSHRLRVSMV